MGLENRICTEPEFDIESASDDNEGVPAHAAYHLLGDDVSCDEETGSPFDSHGADRSLASGTSFAQAEEQAAHGTHESTSHVHCLSAAVDCPSAGSRATASVSLSPQRIDAGTLVATARALNAGCQPVMFARWESTDTDASSEGPDRSDRHSQRPPAPSHDQAGRDARTRNPQDCRHRPKVLISQRAGGSERPLLDLTEEKRTAIQGAMKNIDLNYMPQWAAAVPEQAWIRAVKSDKT